MHSNTNSKIIIKEKSDEVIQEDKEEDQEEDNIEDYVDDIDDETKEIINRVRMKQKEKENLINPITKSFEEFIKESLELSANKCVNEPFIKNKKKN